MPATRSRFDETHRDAARLLGDDHVLSRALLRQRTIGWHLRLLWAASVGGALAAATGASWLVPGASAATVGIWIVAAFATHHQVRIAAVEVIAAGGESLPLPIIARERARLLSPRTRTRLSKTFARHALGPSGPTGRPWTAATPVDLIASRTLRDELLAVSVLLKTAAPDTSGVARAERFLRQGFLVTHGRDADVLRTELERMIVSLAPNQQPRDT